ncbi:MAG: TolC family protein [Desulfuromonadaceae bacterium]|nr:TolC family protein [Desulfuromonadaceae bacterium]MDD2854642.1 TolC family protein [Desulfuromonadaceae bacterium]
MKSYFILFALLFATGRTAVSADLIKPADTLPELFEQALANNPELKSSRARWQVYTDRVSQASALEDPMVMFKLQNLLARKPFSLGGNDPATAKVIGVSQQLPFWGKRANREEIATLEAESYRWRFEEQKLQLRRMLTETYYQIWSLDKSLQLIEKNLKIISDFISIAESRYSVGQGVQQDIYKAGLERSKLLDKQIVLRQQRMSLAAGLNYLLNRPGGTQIATPPDFELPEKSVAADILNALSLENRPELKALKVLEKKGNVGRALAEKEYYPDFNLSFEYMFRQAAMGASGDNMFTVGVTFNLPLQKERRHAMLAESNSETNMADSDFNALKSQISYTISDTVARLERYRNQIQLYKNGIIPQAEQSLESAVISYRVGRIDILALLDGQMNLLNYERELYASEAEYMISLASLEAAVGVELH